MHFTQALALLAPLIGTSTAVPTTLRSRYAIKESHIVPRHWKIVGSPSQSDNLNLQIGLTQQNQDILEQHATEVSDPNHARYGQHLTAEEVHSLVAPSEDTIRLVQDWLRLHGITHGKVNPSKDWISIDLPVSKAEELLNTTYSTFQHTDGSTLIRAPVWSLPESLHEHVDVVQPTTSFFRPGKQSTDLIPEKGGSHWHDVQWLDRHWRPAPYKPSPGSTANISAVCNVTFTTLECLRTLYGTIDYVPQVPEKNSIAVTNYLMETQLRSDIKLYLQKFRPEAAQIADEFPITIVDGGVDAQNVSFAIQNDVDVEGNLDGELVIGISYPTKFSAWNTGGEPPVIHDLNMPTGNTNEPYVTWLNYVLAQDTLPFVISTSYGDNEQTVPYSYAKRACDGYKQLAARGISVLVSSGDSGVGSNGTCFSVDNSTAEFTPAFPTSCPWVTSVGGTAGFQPEVAVSRFGSGAGFSNYFPQPAYQTTAVKGYIAKIGNLYAGLYNRSGRAYPDVAAQGNHDVIVWAGNVSTVGGTSASSPTFAAVIALVNDALIAEGKAPLGFLNPWIYGGAYRSLTDVTSGSSIGCNTSGFPAEVGWDAVTGYGTPVFPKLVHYALKTAKGYRE